MVDFMIFLSCSHRECNAASIPSVKAMLFKGSIEEHWVTMHLGSCHMQCTCMELDIQNWAVLVQHRWVWKTWPKKINWCWCFSAFCCPTVATSSKVCLRNYCQLLSVSGVTKSIYKYILESHKSPSYSAKGRRAAIHQQHWKTLWAHPELQGRRQPLPPAQAQRLGISKGLNREPDESKRKQWKQWDEKADERLCKVTSSATTDENNDYELSCVTGPGQSTSPAHDNHQLYSKIKLCNHLYKCRSIFCVSQ